MTIMQMEAGLDTGPMSKAQIRIADDDTTESLTEKLADLGAKELSATIPPWVNGEIPATTGQRTSFNDSSPPQG